MSVSQHLRISIDEYDARIRTFVPNYETMLGVVAEALTGLQTAQPTIVDLGTGTGALAARCLQVRPNARLIGIDSDAAMLEAARARLGAQSSAPMLEAARARLGAQSSVELRTGDFLSAVLPPCDAIVACIALHHIRGAQEKQSFYASCSAALRPGGVLLNADCFPAQDVRLAAEQRALWRSHLERSYTRAESEAHLAAWAQEDMYFPLNDELEWLNAAGLSVEVIWRVGGFAVILAGADSRV